MPSQEVPWHIQGKSFRSAPSARLAAEAPNSGSIAAERPEPHVALWQTRGYPFSALGAIFDS
jgi:hypothetical protein